jgi:hypothetical protein
MSTNITITTLRQADLNNVNIQQGLSEAVASFPLWMTAISSGHGGNMVVGAADPDWINEPFDTFLRIDRKHGIDGRTLPLGHYPDSDFVAKRSC